MIRKSSRSTGSRAASRLETTRSESTPKKSPASSRPGSVVWASIRTSSSRSRSISAPESTPKTARMITSRVIACILSISDSVSPSFQVETSRSTASSMISPYRRIRSPWKGGSRSRRSRRWRASSRSRTELEPTIGSSTMLASPACITSAGPVKIVRTSSGSQRTTSGKPVMKSKVKTSPNRSRWRSMNCCGRASHCSACAYWGWRGPGGRSASSGASRLTA